MQINSWGFRQNDLDKGPTILQGEEFVTHEEIQRYFNSVKARWKEEAEAAKAKELEAEAKQDQHVSRMLRYNEPLKLNRKGHQAVFRSITRHKRNNLADGKNGILDKTPNAAYYKPKYDFVRKDPF